MTLADVWTYFAETECGDYSRLYRRISHVVAANDDVLDLVRTAPRRAHQPTVLLGAVHFLVLGGLDHPLAAVYAGSSDADADADVGPLFVDLCLTYRDEILALLATRHTNTNEVGRSAVIGPALTTVALRLGPRLGLVDVGCSAGLNLLCDRYLLDYGTAGRTGPADATVRIACEVIGGGVPVASTLPEIGSRVGLDRDPIDLNDADEARWLLACIWPDTGRLDRARLALQGAREHPPRLVRGDAVDDVTAVTDSLPADVIPVVLTTWALAYLSAERRVEFRARLAAASMARPIAWVSAEGPGVVDFFNDIDEPPDIGGAQASVLGLVVFRNGVPEPHHLGFVHPHGTWIDWRA